MWKRRTALAAALCLFASGAAKGKSPAVSASEAASALAAATKISDIRAEGAAPFRLVAKFKFRDVDSRFVAGTVTLSWQSAKRWREEIAFAGHTESAGCEGDTPWLASDLPYRPLGLFDLIDAITFTSRLERADGSTVEGARAGRWKSKAVLRVSVSAPGRLPLREFWIDRDSGTLIREEQRPAPAPLQRYVAAFEYADYRPWHGLRFPFEIRRLDGRRETLVVNVVSIEALPDDFRPGRPDAAAAAPLCADDAEPSRARCEPTVRLERQGTEVPARGLVGIRAVIGRDGKVHDAIVVQSVDFTADGDALRYVEGYRCRPRTCDGSAVDSQAFETVRFEAIGP